MSQRVMSPKQTRERIGVLRKAPIAALGMAPRGWNYTDKSLLRRACAIMEHEGLSGLPYEAAPMVFWYRTANGDIHCHDWTDQEN